MEHGPTTLAVQVIADPGATAEDLAHETDRLRRELLDLDVDAVLPVPAGAAPEGARAAELLALGGLVVHLAQSVPLSVVVGTVRSWLTSAPRRSITLEIEGDRLELTGVSSSEQQRLADEWLRRHPVG